MIRNYRELTRLEMEAVDKKETIVLIPVGALEQHGNQAPLGTDDIIAEAMCEYLTEALVEAGEEDFPMLIFPVIPVGLSTEHKNFCGSVTLRPDTYYHMLYDIAVSLAHHGFEKLAFLVCHGGNAPIIQVLSRELRSELKKVVWPTPKQVLKNTAIVVGCVVAVGVFIWLFDFVAQVGINALIGALN